MAATTSNKLKALAVEPDIHAAIMNTAKRERAKGYVVAAEAIQLGLKARKTKKEAAV